MHDQNAYLESQGEISVKPSDELRQPQAAEQKNRSPLSAASLMRGMNRRSEDRGVPTVAPLASTYQDDGGAPRYDLKS